MTTLPKSLNYESMSSLPAGTKSTQVVINPNNGASFSSAGSVIQFDLLQKGFIIPSSLTLSYTMNIKTTAGTTADLDMLGVPAYTPIQRLETLHNGNVIESVNQYNALHSMLVATKLSQTQKASLAPALGLANKTFSATTSGRVIVNDATTNGAGQEFSVACPLGCLISNCDKLFPSAYTGAMRVQLTLDDVQNCFAKVGVAGSETHQVASMTLSNLTLKYDCVEFSPEIDQMVFSSLADEAGNIHIKSQTFQTSTQTLPANSVGQTALIYNARLSSIKSLIAQFQESSTATIKQVNGKFASVDVTSQNGSYQFQLNGLYYPQRPINTKSEFMSGFLELNSCWSQPSDILSTQMSIKETEYRTAPADTTTSVTGGKHYVGINVENMSGASGTLFSGISSQLSPINLNLTLNTSSGASSRQVDLFVCHDAIVSVNVATRDLVVKQ